MMQKDAVDLINAELDGELTTNQELQLKTILSTSSEAVEYRNQMRDMDKLLSNQPIIEPPENFHVPVNLNPKRNQTWYSPLLDYLLAYTTPMATASVLVALLSVNLYYYHNQNTNIESLVGSMVSDASISPSTILDTKVFASPNFKGQLNLNQQDNLYIVTLQADAQDEITIDLGYVGSGLTLSGFAQNNNTVVRFLVENDVLSLSYSGNDEVVIFLEPVSAVETLTNHKREEIQLEYRIGSFGQQHNGILGEQN